MPKSAVRCRRVFAVLWLAERKSLHPMDSNKATRWGSDATEWSHHRFQNMQYRRHQQKRESNTDALCHNKDFNISDNCNLVLDGRILLKRISNIKCENLWTALIWFRTQISARFVISLEKLRKTTHNVSHFRLSSDWDLYPAFPTKFFSDNFSYDPR
jgi:hypothetical protein